MMRDKWHIEREVAGGQSFLVYWVTGSGREKERAGYSGWEAAPVNRGGLLWVPSFSYYCEA